ncbi:unnamed protein product [Chironomus riparius]|uniref:Secreted protein n=1 Tax=Chironomus riparius TaxID=315576 RepID=A0A9N9S5A0_9DIPT|nr:unnamed protein product [Chironomus riparius]
MKLNLKFFMCLIVLIFVCLSSTDAQSQSYAVNDPSGSDYYYDYYDYDYYGCYGDYYYDSLGSGPYGASAMGSSSS